MRLLQGQLGPCSRAAAQSAEAGKDQMQREVLHASRLPLAATAPPQLLAEQGSKHLSMVAASTGGSRLDKRMHWHLHQATLAPAQQYFMLVSASPWIERTCFLLHFPHDC
jgi:hypothetical protein